MLQNKKSSKDLLLKLISVELSKDGFQPKIYLQAFYKNIQNGKCAFHLSFLNRVYGFEVMADAAVRLDAVEDIVNNYPINPLLNDKERKEIFTVGTNFIVNGKPPIWEVEFEDDIQQIATSIVKLFREKGFSYHSYNSSLENIIKTLQKDAAAGSRLLTVSYLLNNKVLFDEIAEKQKKLFGGKKDFKLNQFLILENELRKRFNQRFEY